jgi:metal-dependent HD superfamily phosphatase/phosphodiesterase
MKTLVWVEHDNARSVKDATLAAVTAARSWAKCMLVAGSGVRAVADGRREDRGRGQGACRR